MRPIPMPTMDDEKQKRTAPEGRDREVATAVAVAFDAFLVAAAMAGASLLAWWTVAFHPSNSRLWMVPVGLVLACTPVIVYLALFFSQSPRQSLSSSSSGSERGADAAGKPPPPPLSMVVIDK